MLITESSLILLTINSIAKSFLYLLFKIECKLLKIISLSESLKACCIRYPSLFFTVGSISIEREVLPEREAEESVPICPPTLTTSIFFN